VGAVPVAVVGSLEMPDPVRVDEPATESAVAGGFVARGFVHRDQSTWSTRRTAMIRRTANRVLRSMKSEPAPGYGTGS